VLLGVSEESKAYKLYNPIERKIIVSRDVVFEEDKGWNWHEKESVKQIDDVSVNDETDEIEVENPNVDIGNEVGIENVIVNDTEDEDSANSNNDEGSDYDSEGYNDLPPRSRNPPSYLRDYVTNSEAVDDQMQNLAIAMFSSSEDPSTYEEASKLDVWRKAMDSEIHSIESNKTWELTTLPQGTKAIGVKWVYNTMKKEKLKSTRQG
jgi:hypothetical protein